MSDISPSPKNNASFNFNEVKHFFFDFDGVILKSVDVKTKAFYKMYRPFGDDVATKAAAHHRTHGGMSRFEKFRIYHKELLGKELTESEVAKLAKEFSKLVFNEVLKCPYVPGVRDFLQWTLKNDLHCYIVTGTPETEILEIVKQLGIDPFFRAIKGSPLRKEELLKNLLHEFCIEPEASVFFGDSITDLEAAKKNNVPFIGIQYKEAPIHFNDFKFLEFKKDAVS